jgi:hypothetical protein
MKCLKCGLENAENGTVCRRCSSVLSKDTSKADIDDITTKLKTSKLAVASMILGITAWFLLGFLGAILGIIFGIIAIIKINRSSGLLKGLGFAIAGITTGGLQILVFGILIVGLFLSVLHGMALSPRNPEGILKTGRLAVLPESATDIKAEGWSGIFTGEDYLMFRATPEGIEKFIAESPSIKDTEPEIFSSKKMYLPYHEPNDFADEADWEDHYNHNYFFPQKDQPEWYDITIKLKGRRYKIPAFEHHNWGSVIINDETNTVYINVIWS